jgi:hypothetical protein
MKADVGKDKGCFDMAPYDTRCASLPRYLIIAVVSFPPTSVFPY